MRQSKEGSRYAIPFDNIPALGQVSDDSAKVLVSKETWHVLEHAPSGRNFPNRSNCVWPKIPFIVYTFLRSCYAPGLTGESPANKINGRHGCEVNFFDIAIARHLGPMFLEHFLAVGVFLHLPNHFHPGTFKAQIKTAYAAK
jgi:hypothetical protein